MPRIPTVALLGLLARIASAQLESHQLTPSANMRLAPLAGGGHLILSERRFGIDSSHAQVLLADADWNVTPLAARRFQYPLWYLFDAVPTPSGMVASGTLPSGSIPQLHAVNNDGSLAWVTGFAGMQHSQHRIAMLFSEGAAIHGYTSQDGFFGSGVYRVETEQTGSGFAFRLTTVSNTQFRFYHGAKAGSPGNHVLGGSIRNTGTNEYDALLSHFTASGATWMKRFDLGGPNAGTEQVTGVVRLSNGEIGWALFTSGNPSRGFYLRTDLNGGVVGGALIVDPVGLYTAGITELDDGSILLSASSGPGVPRLIHLTAGGSLISATECNACPNGGIGRFHQNASGNLFGMGSSAIHSIGADGEACGYLPISGVTSTAFTPTLVDLAFVNNTSPAVTTTNLIMLERAPVGTMAQVCIQSGVNEVPARPPLTAHPVPCADRLWLGAPGEIVWNEPVEVRDMTGALALSTAYGMGVDIGALPTGMYVATLPRTSRRAVFIKAAD